MVVRRQWRWPGSWRMTRWTRVRWARMVGMRGRAPVAMVVGVSALGLLPLATTTGCLSGPPWRQRVAIPAYWTPADPAGRATFRRLAASAPATRIVVVN